MPDRIKKDRKLYPYPISNLLRYKISIIKYSIIYFFSLLVFYVFVEIPVEADLFHDEQNYLNELLLSGFVVSSYFIFLAVYIYHRIFTRVKKDLETDKIRELEQLLHEQKTESNAYHQELKERTVLLEKQAEEIRQKNIELKLAQHEIREKANNLEMASKYKSEFFANISHEFRTPLNSIIVLSQLIAENRSQNLTEKQQEFARTIYSSGNVLLELINEILEVTRIESGKIELRPEYITLWELTDQLKMMFQPVAQQKGLEFCVELDQDLPEKIFSDAKRLHQILRNLISNAIKFTEKGSIRIHLSRLPIDTLKKGDAGPGVSISVIDTGIGIPDDKKTAIFEAFQQGDGTISNKYGGTGLGLTIARSLANMMGGEVTVSSAPGQGSVFTLHVPEKISLKKIQDLGLLFSPWKENIPGGSEEAFPGNCNETDDRALIKPGDRTVLIVDDDLSFANLLFDFARESGYKALIAKTGTCAIELARQYRPGVIILDICLPDKNGWEVMNILKVDPNTSQIPIFFISGAEESNEVTEMGALGFLTKPVSVDKMREMFGSFGNITRVPVHHVGKDEIPDQDEKKDRNGTNRKTIRSKTIN